MLIKNIISVKFILVLFTGVFCLFFNFKFVHADVIIAFTQEIKPMEAKEYARQKKVHEEKKKRVEEKKKKLKEVDEDRKSRKNIKQLTSTNVESIEVYSDILLPEYSLENLESLTTGSNFSLLSVHRSNKDPTPT